MEGVGGEWRVAGSGGGPGVVVGVSGGGCRLRAGREGRGAGNGEVVSGGQAGRRGDVSGGQAGRGGGVSGGQVEAGPPQPASGAAREARLGSPGRRSGGASSDEDSAVEPEVPCLLPHPATGPRALWPSLPVLRAVGDGPSFADSRLTSAVAAVGP